jgi:carbonic anhydrase
MVVSRVAAALLAFSCAVAAAAQRTPDEALRALQDGNRRFATGRSAAQPLGEGVRRTLTRGQSPTAIVLCCADSRVPPEHVFNAGLGELFVVRVAGHVCDSETLASIEHAVEHLGVPLCVVLSHEDCGAVAAAAQRITGPASRAVGPQTPALEQLYEQLEPAVRRARARDLLGSGLRAAGEEEHAQHTVRESLRRSELLRRYAAIGRFRMVAARYRLESGEVEWLPERPLPAVSDAPSEIVPGAVPTGVAPHVALRMLQAGHRRYLGDGRPSGDVSASRREALTHAQQPLAIVLTCADSRVAPEHIFDAGLGELCVVRLAGSTLSDDALASIEYAAARTGASLLVVMGHTQCSAMRTAAQKAEGSEMSAHMRALIAHLEPAVAHARASGVRGDALVDLAVKANAMRTIVEARSRSTLLRQLEAAGRFVMLPVVYDLGTGDLDWLKDTLEQAPAAAPSGETRPASPAPPPAAAAQATPRTGPEWPRSPAAAAVAPAAPSGWPATEPDAPDRGPSLPVAEEPAPAPAPWGLDQRLLIGLGGVLSLSLAALLLLRLRS